MLGAYNPNRASEHGLNNAPVSAQYHHFRRLLCKEVGAHGGQVHETALTPDFFQLLNKGLPENEPVVHPAANGPVSNES